MSSTTSPLVGERATLQPSEAKAIIRRHSASFSLASLLLEPSARQNAHVLYAYCRRADDAIDLVAPAQAPAALTRLRRELDAVYAGEALSDATASEFQRLVFDLQLPRAYPEALLQGFELDASGACYATLRDLQLYCWCVAGSVGAMMCHVLGAPGVPAIVHGAHLGMAMQLTNVCRDVAEDWGRGRLYVPLELLPGWQRHEPAQLASWPPSPHELELLSSAVVRLLDEAEAFYRSGEAGLRYLPWRSRVAVATARRVYGAIGTRLLRRNADVTAPRAFVSTSEKAGHAARAALAALLTRRAPASAAAAYPLRFPDDVLPL